jgi:hypothetical protein
MAKPKIVYDPTQKEIVVESITHKATIKKPEAEPKPEEAPVVIEKSAKPKVERKAKVEKPKSAEFPFKAFINAYGFVRLSAKVLEAFGAEKGKKTPITIDRQDNALIIRKA